MLWFSLILCPVNKFCFHFVCFRYFNGPLHRSIWHTFPLTFRPTRYMEQQRKAPWRRTCGGELWNTWIWAKLTTVWFLQLLVERRTSFSRSRTHFRQTTDCSPFMITRAMRWAGWWPPRKKKALESWVLLSGGPTCELRHPTWNASWRRRRKKRINPRKGCLFSPSNLALRGPNIRISGCRKRRPTGGTFFWTLRPWLQRIWILSPSLFSVPNSLWLPSTRYAINQRVVYYIAFYIRTSVGLV